MKLAAPLSSPVTVLAAAVLIVAGLVTACGAAGGAAPIEPRAPADVQTPSAAPAMPPTGSTARDVSYRCSNGREGTLVVDVPDLDRLADRLNRIQPCEYDSGLSRATLTVMCGVDTLVVHLPGNDGRVEQPPKATLCAQ